MPIILHPENEASWIAMRAEDVSSTESAALFGFSPYATKFELWHRKKGNYSVEFTATARTRWGQRLESVVAQAIAEENGVTVRNITEYMRHDTAVRMGASFDYEIVGLADGWTGADNYLRSMFRQYGPGILEIKCVDYLVFRDNWMDDGEGIEAPEHIEIQVQHQLEVCNREWAAIAVLIAGNDLRLTIRDRDEEIGAQIAGVVAAFWELIDANTPPAADYANDGPTIRGLYGVTSTGKTVDLSGSNRLAELVKNHADAKASLDIAEAAKEAAMMEIREMIGDAETVHAPGGFTVKARDVAPAPISYERKGYRDVRVNKPKAPAKRTRKAA